MVIELFSCARYLKLTVPPSTQVYKWEVANFTYASGSPAMDQHPIQQGGGGGGERRRNTVHCFMLRQTEKNARLVWDWVPAQTLQIFEHLYIQYSRRYSSCTYVDMNTKTWLSAELCYGRERSERFMEDLEKTYKT